MAGQAGIAFVFQGLEKQAQQQFRRARGAPRPHTVPRLGVVQGSIAHLILWKQSSLAAMVPATVPHTSRVCA